MELKTDRIPAREELLMLYADAGWTAYTDDPDRLERAVRASLRVYTVWDGDTLAGLLRAVGDGETILYVQDILVLTAYQRRGIGRMLLERVLTDCPAVRQRILLTDSTEKTERFYRSCGWLPVEELGCTAFWKV